MRKSVRIFAYALVLSVTVGALHSTSALAADEGAKATVDGSLESVNKAAADALTVVGCEIKKNEPNQVEGVRSHKIGVFVGSGGETVSVSLSAADGGKVDVVVRTKKSMVGYAGQKNWDEPVLAEIKKTLSAPAPSPAN